MFPWVPVEAPLIHFGRHSCFFFFPLWFLVIEACKNNQKLDFEPVPFLESVCKLQGKREDGAGVWVFVLFS